MPGKIGFIASLPVKILIVSVRDMTDEVWILPPTRFSLPPDEVHVFRVALDQMAENLQRFLDVLSPDEVARASRFHFDIDRKRFIVCRGVLRTILSRYLDLKPYQLEFDYGRRGKPFLKTPDRDPPFSFNLSHSQGLALYAVTLQRSVGIDLEYIRPISGMDSIAARFFSPNEFAVWRDLAPPDRAIAFFNCWTRKEAYLKAIGEGLASPLDGFDVTLAPGVPAQLLNIRDDNQTPENWCLLDLGMEPSYVSALAVEGHDWQLKRWQFIP